MDEPEKYGELYMIPCPIAETSADEVLPPINNDIIRSLDYFIVEDLRSARRFLSRTGVGRPIDTLQFAELNEHTPFEDIPEMITPILEGRSAGVISEAGLPGIADPGSQVASLCHLKGIRVRPLTGPSSIFMALMASGLNGQSFAFNGYLPVKPPDRQKAIRRFEERAISENQSQIFIETPYRNTKLFADFLAVCRPRTMLTVAIDLTGKNEYIKTASVWEWKNIPVPDLHKKPAVFIIL